MTERVFTSDLSTASIEAIFTVARKERNDCRVTSFLAMTERVFASDLSTASIEAIFTVARKERNDCRVTSFLAMTERVFASDLSTASIEAISSAARKERDDCRVTSFLAMTERLLTNSLSYYHHRITITEKSIFSIHSNFVSIHYIIITGKCRNKHHQGGFRHVEIRY